MKRQGMQERDQNENCLGQYPKKLCQKSGINMNENERSTEERLFLKWYATET